jgi:hypothetical protein
MLLISIKPLSAIAALSLFVGKAELAKPFLPSVFRAAAKPAVLLIFGYRFMNQGNFNMSAGATLCAYPWTRATLYESLGHVVSYELHVLEGRRLDVSMRQFDIDDEAAIAKGAGVNVWIRTASECEALIKALPFEDRVRSAHVEKRINAIMRSHQPNSFRWQTDSCDSQAEWERIVNWLYGLLNAGLEVEP